MSNAKQKKSLVFYTLNYHEQVMSGLSEIKEVVAVKQAAMSGKNP